MFLDSRAISHSRLPPVQVNHIFQYSLNPKHELIRFDQMDQIDGEDDAFTFTWKAILRKVHDALED